jgi:hypothetical protein
MKRRRTRTRGKRRYKKKVRFTKKRISKKSRIMRHLKPDGYYTEKVVVRD